MDSFFIFSYNKCEKQGVIIDREIPFSKPFIGEEEIEEVNSVLRNKWITTGEKTIEFENSVKEYLGVDTAIAVSSGTAAIDISLAVKDVGENDEIITTPLTFVSTVHSIVHRGARPVLIDIDEKTFNLSSERVRDFIKTNYEKTENGLRSKRTKKNLKGIIIVHYGGQAANIDAFNKIARKYNLFIIEDAAHAIGAKQNNIPIGNSKNAVCFSFYSNKNITTGEGGMIVMKDNFEEEKYRKFSLHGISKSNIERYKTGLPFYDVEFAGFKNNLTDIQAAMGIAQMRKIKYITKRRNEIAKKYDELLSDISEIKTPFIKQENYSARHLYPILINPDLRAKRNEILIELRKKYIFPSVHFIPVHFFSFYKDYFRKEDVSDLKVSEDVFNRELSLPIFPELKDEEIKRVVETLKTTLLKIKK